jgi:membrane-bound lytic murein transglycosylase D
MRKLLSGIFLLLSITRAFGEDQGKAADTTNIYLADSITATMEMYDVIESNFDINLDSMLNLYYVRQFTENDTTIFSASDSLIPDFPDSVYMARLAAIPTTIDLAYNRIVKSYIDVYTRRKRSSVEVMLGLSNHYFPIFDDIFDYYGIPNEMKYMAIIESALNPRAYSRTRAVGLWQFMYGTGRIYGLEINSMVDERRDPYKSTHAAARFCRDLYKIYNDWILVIAAYNCGPGNVNKAIRRSGGKTNYWDIYYHLPRETRGHVPAFIAATYVMNYAAEHNLRAVPVDVPAVTDTIMLNQKMHLQQVAEVLGLPLKQVRDLNPQYSNDIIPASAEKQYVLSLPAWYIGKYIDFEDAIYAYKDSVFFNPNRMIVSPESNYANNLPEAPGADFVKIVYTVKSGDNVGYISEWYDVRISDLSRWNNIRKNVIRSGQTLVIYKPKSQADKYAKINKMTFAEKQRSIGKTVGSPGTATTTPINYAGDFVTHTVRSGDTLWDIAKLYPGVSDTDIMRLNNITDASKIRPGQQLKIKPKN